MGRRHAAGSGLVYATETQTSAFTSFDLATPGTINTITGFSDGVFAGDFAMDGMLYVENNVTGNLESVTTAGVRTVIGPSAPGAGQAWAGLALDPTTGTMYTTLFPYLVATGDSLASLRSRDPKRWLIL